MARARPGRCSSSPRDPADAPDEPRYVEIDFEEGDPVAVDGERLGPAALLARLNNIAGEHGVGRVDLVEDRFVGMKSRGVYETPGGTVLHKAHRAVESLTMDREVMRLRDGLVPRVRGAGLQRLLVLARARGAADADRRRPRAASTGTARLQALQGRAHRRRPQGAALALPRGHRHVRGGRASTTSATRAASSG